MDFNITILGQIISFTIFVIICMKFIWPPLVNVIEKRQKDLKNVLDMEKKIKVDFETSKKIIKKEINEAKIVANNIIKEANKNKRKILELVELEAVKKKDSLISQAYSEIEIKRQIVYNELKEEISDIALIMAKKIIKNTIKKDINIDFNKLINKKSNIIV